MAINLFTLLLSDRVCTTLLGHKRTQRLASRQSQPLTALWLVVVLVAVSVSDASDVATLVQHIDGDVVVVYTVS